jgi:hypothetical protein
MPYSGENFSLGHTEIQIFWEGHKNLKKYFTLFYSNVVAFFTISEFYLLEVYLKQVKFRYCKKVACAEIADLSMRLSTTSTLLRKNWDSLFISIYSPNIFLIYCRAELRGIARIFSTAVYFEVEENKLLFIMKVHMLMIKVNNKHT